MLVNVAGSPGDEIEGIDYLEFVEEDDDDGDEEVEDFQAEELSCKELPESEQHEDKDCSGEELRDVKSERNCTDSIEISQEGEDSVRSLSPETNNHGTKRLNEDSDPDQKSVSDAELANLLKTLKAGIKVDKNTRNWFCMRTSAEGVWVGTEARFSFLVSL